MVSVLCILTFNPHAAQAAESRPVRVATAKGAATRTPAVPVAVVTDLKHWSNPDYTRIAVSVDHEAEFETHSLRPSLEATAPSRIYIDIKGARVAKGVKDDPISDGLLKTVRVAQFRPDVVRVVLDVENIKDYKVFSLSDPFRIVIDVKGERKTEIAKLEETIMALQREKERLPEMKPESPATAEPPAKTEAPGDPTQFQAGADPPDRGRPGAWRA